MFCLQRQKVLRHPSASFMSRPYPGQLPQPYHHLPHGAPAPLLYKPRAGAKRGVLGASTNLILTVAVLLSLALCFLTAAHWGAPSRTAAAQQESSLSQPGAWVASIFFTHGCAAACKGLRARLAAHRQRKHSNAPKKCFSSQI